MIINKKGFTLIELLIAIAIVGIMITIATFGVRGARSTARDAKRKTDIQNIKSALEFFYSDCGYYPSPVSNQLPNPLTGDDRNARCLSSNVYMSQVPQDPQPSIRRYYYARPSATSYIICSALEEAPDPPDDVTGCSGATNCGEACNLKITGP